MSEIPTGRFVWYDLMTTDPEAAIGFYGALVGWGTQIFEGAGTPYTMWTHADVPIGGVIGLSGEARQAGAPPHWIAYVAVDDVDATLARAGELGARVMVPGTDIPTIGRFGMIMDPQDAPIAVYTSDGPPQAHLGPPCVGQFSWHEHAAGDSDSAWEFYSGLFGWTVQEEMDMGEMGTYRIFGRPDEHPLGGMFTKPPEMPVTTWLYYVKVNDVAAAAETVAAAGGRVLNGPMEVPGGDFIAQCMDPQGAAFALHSTAAAAE